jgi:hypothetical protein
MKPVSFCFAAIVVFCLVGCGVALPKVKVKGATAQGPRDIGAPAVVESGGTVTTLPVPAGSTVESVPAVPASATSGAIPASVKVVLAGASELRSETHQAKASSGTTDTTVAVKRIEMESAASERRPLIWVAIVCGVLGVLARSLVKEWPAVGNGLLGASVLAALAWKVAEIPWWAFAALLVVVALGIAFYKRAEWDKDGNSIPDVLEKQSRS